MVNKLDIEMTYKVTIFFLYDKRQIGVVCICGER